MDKPLTAPSHLKAATRTWWQSVVSRWKLQPHHVRLLTLAAETWDRGVQARMLLARDGLTTGSKSAGCARIRPVRIEADCRVGFARLLRELDSDAGTAEVAGLRLCAQLRGNDATKTTNAEVRVDLPLTPAMTYCLMTGTGSDKRIHGWVALAQQGQFGEPTPDQVWEMHRETLIAEAHAAGFSRTGSHSRPRSAPDSGDGAIG